VIFHSVNRVNEDSILFADPSEVGIEPGFEFPWDQLAAVFGAEDKMDRVLRVGMRHVSIAPTALVKFIYHGPSPCGLG